MSFDMKPCCRKAFAALVLLLLAGCRQAWQLDVDMRDSELIFAFPEEAAGQQIGLQEFQVVKRDCTVDCVFWSVKSRITDSGDMSPWTVVGNTIEFGKDVPELKTIVAPKKFTPGSYSAGGSVSLYENGSFSDSRVIFSEFELSADGEGLAVIRR